MSHIELLERKLARIVWLRTVNDSQALAVREDWLRDIITEAYITRDLAEMAKVAA